MGLSNAIVAIKGNQLENIGQISEILNYFEDENLINEISGAAQFKNGWTILIDEEMVFVTEEDLLQELSEELDTEVFSFTIQSTSATYGFSYFNKDISRVFLVQDGDIITNEGDKLIQEKDLSIDKNISKNEILKIAKKISIDI